MTIEDKFWLGVLIVMVITFTYAFIDISQKQSEKKSKEVYKEVEIEIPVYHLRCSKETYKGCAEYTVYRIEYKEMR